VNFSHYSDGFWRSNEHFVVALVGLEAQAIVCLVLFYFCASLATGQSFIHKVFCVFPWVLAHK